MSDYVCPNGHPMPETTTVDCEQCDGRVAYVPFAKLLHGDGSRLQAAAEALRQANGSMRRGGEEGIWIHFPEAAWDVLRPIIYRDAALAGLRDTTTTWTTRVCCGDVLVPSGEDCPRCGAAVRDPTTGDETGCTCTRDGEGFVERRGCPEHDAAGGGDA